MVSRLLLARSHVLQGEVLEALPPDRCASGTCVEHAANAYRRALHRAPRGAEDVPEAQRIGPLGLSEFCNVMVEEYEDELAEAISKATSAAKTGLFAGMYEMKESVCVATAGACKSEQLNTITAHRIGQARNMSPEKMRQLQEAMAQSEAVPADPAHKDEV